MRKLAPLGASLAMLLVLGQWAFLGGSEGLIVALFLGAPALTTCAVTWNLATGNRRASWIGLGVGFALHFLVIFLTMVAASRGTRPILEAVVPSLVSVIVSMGLFLVVVAPLLLVTAHFARRQDLASGDGLLFAIGTWQLVLQLLELSLFRTAYAIWAVGITAACACMVTAMMRTQRRRAWAHRVEQGEIPGLRLRALDRRDLDLRVPPLDDEAHGDLAVVERLEVGELPYRSTSIGVPIVMIRTAVNLTP